MNLIKSSEVSEVETREIKPKVHQYMGSQGFQTIIGNSASKHRLESSVTKIKKSLQDIIESNSLVGTDTIKLHLTNSVLDEEAKLENKIVIEEKTERESLVVVAEKDQSILY